MSSSRPRHRRSLTRFEALALLAATAALGGGYWLFSSDAAAKDDQGQAARSAEKIQLAARTWQADHAGCPTLTQLQRSQMLSEEDSADPWGERYRLSCDAGGVSVSSLGRDRKPGTADDIEK